MALVFLRLSTVRTSPQSKSTILSSIRVLRKLCRYCVAMAALHQEPSPCTLLLTSKFGIQLFRATRRLSDQGPASGGALGLRWSSLSQNDVGNRPILWASIENSTFIQNSITGAPVSGGAIYVDHIFRNLSISQCTFDTNSVLSKGATSF